MKTPYELAYRYVIPYIQRRLVQALKERGMTNTEIANKLGITPSAVTRYLKGERGTEIDLSTHADIEGFIDSLADAVVEKDLNKYDIIAAVTAITSYALARKYLCTYHARLEKDVDPIRCRVCERVFSGSVELISSLT